MLPSDRFMDDAAGVAEADSDRQREPLLKSYSVRPRSLPQELVDDDDQE